MSNHLVLREWADFTSSKCSGMGRCHSPEVTSLACLGVGWCHIIKVFGSGHWADITPSTANWRKPVIRKSVSLAAGQTWELTKM